MGNTIFDYLILIIGIAIMSYTIFVLYKRYDFKKKNGKCYDCFTKLNTIVVAIELIVFFILFIMSMIIQIAKGLDVSLVAYMIIFFSLNIQDTFTPLFGDESALIFDKKIIKYSDIEEIYISKRFKGKIIAFSLKLNGRKTIFKQFYNGKEYLDFLEVLKDKGIQLIEA